MEKFEDLIEDVEIDPSNDLAKKLGHSCQSSKILSDASQCILTELLSLTDDFFPCESHKTAPSIDRGKDVEGMTLAGSSGAKEIINVDYDVEEEDETLYEIICDEYLNIHSDHSTKLSLECSQNPFATEIHLPPSICDQICDSGLGKDKCLKRTAVKDPITVRRFKLPRSITFRHRQAKLFTKEAGSGVGLIDDLTPPYDRLEIPLDGVHDYKILHVRSDGWLVFIRERDLSITVGRIMNGRLGRVILTPGIAGITDCEVTSGSLVGEVSEGNLEIFMVGSGVVDGQVSGVLLHLGRGEGMWTVTSFPSYIPGKSVGPLFLEEGVLVALLDGHWLFTLDLHDFSSSVLVLADFRRMNDSTLIKGIGGRDLYAVQIPRADDHVGPLVLKLEKGAGGLGWHMPTISTVEDAMGSWYLAKNDLGLLLAGNSMFFTNYVHTQHLRVFVNGGWEGRMEEHNGCNCTGGFVAMD